MGKRTENRATKGQKGFFLSEDGSQLTLGPKKGAESFKPSKEKHRRKKVPFSEMTVRQKMAIVKGMGFDDSRMREIVFGGDMTVFRGEPDKDFIFETQDGGKRIVRRKKGEYFTSKIGE